MESRRIVTMSKIIKWEDIPIGSIYQDWNKRSLFMKISESSAYVIMSKLSYLKRGRKFFASGGTRDVIYENQNTNSG